MARARYVVQVLPDDSPVPSAAGGEGVFAHQNQPHSSSPHPPELPRRNRELSDDHTNIASAPQPAPVIQPVSTPQVSTQEQKELPPEPLPERVNETPGTYLHQEHVSPEMVHTSVSKVSVHTVQQSTEPPPEIRSRHLARVFQKQAEVPDLFAQKNDHVERLFQETRIQEVREEVAISRPRVPKRLQSTDAARENSFRQSLQPETHADKIEHFYKKSSLPPAPPSPTRSKPRTRKTPPLVKRLAFGLFVFAVLVIGVTAAGVGYVQAQVKSTQSEVQSLMEDLRAGQWQSAHERVDVLKHRQARAKALYQFSRPVVRTVMGKDKSVHIDQLFEVSTVGMNVLDTGFDTQQMLEKGFKQFVGKEGGESLETFSHLTGQSEALYSELSTLQARVDQLDNPFHLAVIDDLKTELAQETPRMRKYFAAAQKIGAVLPELLGKEGKKEYLVLLQNNMELRPTGGFIGSFGILSVQNGKFLDFRVEDVYEADGQLNGFVTPPPEIVQYLGEAKWYLRDVNWNPDFPITAQQAQWFLEKEIGVKADGVIAINLHVAEKLLEALGPVELVDYNEVITKDNLYVRAQSHSEMNFFPGSTQKRDFLSALSNQLFYQMMKEDSPKLTLTKAFYESAEESQLLLALNNQQAAAVLQGLGWDGSVRTPPCPQLFQSQTCFVDTVMQVEANVGVNKANQYIRRNIEHEVKIEGGVAQHTRSIQLKNEAKSNAWPEGIYKTYLRLLLSKEANVTKVTVNGANIDLQSLKSIEENGKRVLGMYLEVPIQTTNNVVVEYGVTLPQSAPLAYALFEQKQSGVSNDTMSHRLSTGESNIITVAPQPKTALAHEVLFESNRSTHEFMAIEVK